MTESDGNCFPLTHFHFAEQIILHAIEQAEATVHAGFAEAVVAGVVVGCEVAALEHAEIVFVQLVVLRFAQRN